MKKRTAILFSAMMFFSVGCEQNENNKSENQNKRSALTTVSTVTSRNVTSTTTQATTTTTSTVTTTTSASTTTTVTTTTTPTTTVTTRDPYTVPVTPEYTDWLKDMSVTTDISDLRIRCGPGYDYSIVGEIPKGTTIAVNAEIVDEKSGEIWAYLTYNGVSGWSTEKFLTDYEEPVYNNNTYSSNERDLGNYCTYDKNDVRIILTKLTWENDRLLVHFDIENNSSNSYVVSTGTIFNQDTSSFRLKYIGYMPGSERANDTSWGYRSDYKLYIGTPYDRTHSIKPYTKYTDCSDFYFGNQFEQIRSLSDVRSITFFSNIDSVDTSMYYSRADF